MTDLAVKQSVVQQKPNKYAKIGKAIGYVATPLLAGIGYLRSKEAMNDYFVKNCEGLVKDCGLSKNKSIAILATGTVAAFGIIGMLNGAIGKAIGGIFDKSNPEQHAMYSTRG